MRGLPPCRHFRMLRLSEARRALLAADRELVTVTEIATSFGFVELGRFSVEYRKVFGESPSQTMHHAPPRRILTVSGLPKTVSLSEFEGVSSTISAHSDVLEVTLEQHTRGDFEGRYLRAGHPIAG
jgi:AraC-like DNA-binding protein